MNLPDPIRTYFTARAPQDACLLAAAFAPNAEVQDEGQTLQGPQHYDSLMPLMTANSDNNKEQGNE